jgi:leucyl aminopeptidase
MINVHVVAGARTGAAEAVAVGVFEDRKAEARLAKALAARGFKGGAGEEALVPGPFGGAGAALAVGLGKSVAYTAEGARRAAARVFARAKSERWAAVRVDVESFRAKLAAPDAVRALGEGLLLSSYRFDRYKSKKEDARKLGPRTAELAVRGSEARALGRVLEEARITAEGVFFARDLGNEPANVLFPESYAQRLRAAAAKTPVSVQVFDERRLGALGMGGILAVGRGSARKPRLVILQYRPRRARNARPVVLVGKGITFDTGGISIKPSKDMHEMKFDMCGSAAVAAAVFTAAKLKLPVHVVGLAPLAENMPGGGAQRPGDVITCHNGKTVDVLNTDAEGRLVLADALAYAEKFKPLCVVDIATLTGLCAHFFDHAASGLMGTDPRLVAALRDAGERTGERLWELPLWEDYEDMIKGTTADIQNISRATAGTITAGMFLKHFGGHSPWAHLDVAGTAWASSPKPYRPAGATGVGVRLFIEFLKNYVR